MERSPLVEHLLAVLRDEAQPLDVVSVVGRLRRLFRFAPPEPHVRATLDQHTNLFYRLPDGTYLLRRTWEAQQRQASTSDSQRKREDHDTPAVTPFAPNEYVVFDLETTGRDPTKCKIIQIAALRVRDGTVVGEPLQVLVNPLEPVPREVEALTRITNDQLQNSPPLRGVLPQFLAFIGDLPLVAHNGRTFDGPILARSASEELRLPVQNPVIETLDLAVNQGPCQDSYKLADLGRRFGLVDVFKR